MVGIEKTFVLTWKKPVSKKDWKALPGVPWNKPEHAGEKLPGWPSACGKRLELVNLQGVMTLGPKAFEAWSCSTPLDGSLSGDSLSLLLWNLHFHHIPGSRKQEQETAGGPRLRPDYTTADKRQSWPSLLGSRHTRTWGYTSLCQVFLY